MKVTFERVISVVQVVLLLVICGKLFAFKEKADADKLQQWVVAYRAASESLRESIEKSSSPPSGYSDEESREIAKNLNDRYHRALKTFRELDRQMPFPTDDEVKKMGL